MEADIVVVAFAFLGIVARELWEFIGEHMGWLEKVIKKRIRSDKA